MANPTSIFKVGQCISARRRSWLIHDIQTISGDELALKTYCVDDDATGAGCTFLPSVEIGLRNVDDDLWAGFGLESPSDPRGFAAYLQTMNWRTATASDAELFQAPFRERISIVFLLILSLRL